MRVFKTKWFARFARREGMTDSRLLEAFQEIDKGLIDVDYGGGLIKKRIARDGGGKRGGYRSIIAYRCESRCVFMFCFAKSDKENLNKNEVVEYKDAAAIYLGFNDAETCLAVEQGEIEEIVNHDKKI